MSVTELQKKLIDKINNTDDVALLEGIYSFLVTDESGAVFELTPGMIEAVEKSQQQIKEGKYFTDKEVNTEIDKWIEK